MAFTVQCTNDKIWNVIPLIEYLNQHQGQDIELIINPEAICLESLGLYKLLDQFKFKKVIINTFNPLEKHPYYTININPVNIFAQESAESHDRQWHWNQSKTFLTLFGRPTANRLGLASYLYEYYRNKTHLHFSWTTDLDNLEMYELDKLLTYDVDSVERVGKLIKNMPHCVLDTSGYIKTGYTYSDPLTSMYKDALVDIVSEAHVLGNTFFATEKTFRPIWCKRPFIIFASANYLDYLHQMGFLTFNDFWDENYDGFEGKDRYLKILKVIDSIAQKTNAELEQMYYSMQHILEHNYNLLSTQSYNRTVTPI